MLVADANSTDGTPEIVRSFRDRLNVNVPVASPVGRFALAILDSDYLVDLELTALEKEGRGDIMIVVGGVVPPQDYAELEGAGVEAIFPPGTVIAEAADLLLNKLTARLGHGREAAE